MSFPYVKSKNLWMQSLIRQEHYWNHSQITTINIYNKMKINQLYAKAGWRFFFFVLFFTEGIASPLLSYLPLLSFFLFSFSLPLPLPFHSVALLFLCLLKYLLPPQSMFSIRNNIWVVIMFTCNFENVRLQQAEESISRKWKGIPDFSNHFTVIFFFFFLEKWNN